MTKAIWDYRKGKYFTFTSRVASNAALEATSRGALLLIFFSSVFAIGQWIRDQPVQTLVFWTP